MSMLKKLKSFFILTDDEENKKAAEKSEEAHSKGEVIEDEVEKVEVPEIVIDSPPPSGQPNKKFVDILLKAVEKNNKEEFDYLEFKSSLQSLKGMEMDDATMYKSALAMAKTMGATPDKLISTAKHYISILNNERNKFNAALQNQKTKQVTGKEESINKKIQAIKNKELKIKQLQEEIKQDNLKLEEMKENINKSAAKVQKTSDQFHYAFKVVTGQIFADIENMEKYLK